MLNTTIELVQKLEIELVAYKAKPTKTASARIRKLSLELGKSGPAFRSYMIGLDKAK